MSDHFTVSRQAEYFSYKTLASMTGVSVAEFADVVIKELIDNAIDAAETAGTNPVIEYNTHQQENRLTIVVRDNGPGIPPELISKVLDFDTLTSDKAARRLPSRGRQGNALKTIIGIPTALGGGHVVIESNGKKHIINAAIVPGGEVDINTTTDASTITSGTRISVDLPCDPDILSTVNLNAWPSHFEFFNPHVEFVKNEQNGSMVNHEQLFAPENKKPLVFTKVMPNEPTSVHWYSFNDFYELLFLTGRQADKPLGEFIRQFRGLTSTAKAKTIATQFEAKTVSGMSKEDARLLYCLMRDSSKPVQAKALGAIGKDYWSQWKTEQQRGWYKKSEFLVNGVPYLFECMALDNGQNVYADGINHTPTYRDFLPDAWISLNDKMLQGPGGLKSAIDTPFTLFVHLVCPSLDFNDKGKTSLTLNFALRDEVSKCLSSVTAELFKESEKRRKETERRERQREKAERKTEQAEKTDNPYLLPFPRGKAATETSTEEILRPLVNVLIREYRVTGNSWTQRGWCYLLEGLGLGFSKSDFEAISNRITTARKMGLLPLWITSADRTRQTIGGTRVSDDLKTLLTNAVDAIADKYSTTTIEKHTGVHVELIVEKLDLVNLFKNVCEDYGVPLTCSRGWSDLHSRAALLKRCAKHKKNIVMLFGDFDPGGLAITDSFMSNLEEILQPAGLEAMPDIEVKRVGLNFDQINELDLVWIDGLVTSGKDKNGNERDLSKANHPQYKSKPIQEYLQKYGARKCEANALLRCPEKAKQILIDAIKEHVTDEAFEAYQKQRKQDKEKAEKALEKVIESIAA